ncbi:AraC family transcriptional regulator [Niastella caeni]|uniref:AraC family transcriptional regulator n=1 Tax=Niastella caeni TaxID=2569763 RepID=A0A4V4H0L2_9BACT|nr:helix-turn-helix domain-containing protein [Niastella caeni]THU37056.1 AraC family transcriptional regulator [Niastella caeni]
MGGEIIGAIRSQYNPVQPSILLEKDNEVSYLEFMPSGLLQPYIYCYWQLVSQKPLEQPFIYRVVADACMDIYFDLYNPAESYVMGFCKQYTEFALPKSFHYFGVRFLPSAFPHLFSINGKELSNRYEKLEFVIPKLARYIAGYFEPEQPVEKMVSLLDSFFIDWIKVHSPETDHRFMESVLKILKNDGSLQLESDLKTGLSPRQLRRLFHYYIGDSPKTFSQIIRFQSLLKAKPSSQLLKSEKLFFDAGYYDQSHFIKAFKTFYGSTPSQIL